MIEVIDLPSQPPLHLSYTSGSSKRLVVSLAGVGTNRKQVPPTEFARVAHWNGANHVLFVADESRSWLNAPGLAETLVDTVQRIADEVGAEEICALGNSMGGSMAMILASLMPIDAVVAITPQFSVHPELMPDEDRWMFFRNRIADWRFAQMPDLRGAGCAVTILHGDSTDELRHALRFPSDAGYTHYIFERMGHTLARTLHDAEQLASIVSLALLQRPWKLRRAMRQAGGMSRQKYDRLHNTPLSEEAL